MKKMYAFFCAAMGLLCGACSHKVTNENTDESGKVEIDLTIASWNGTKANEGKLTRAVGDDLSPVNILVVPLGEDAVSKQMTLSGETKFILSVGNGAYDIYAVCGLPNDAIPSTTSSIINIPNAHEGGKICYAVGKTSVSVANGTCTPATLDLTAMRQMAWLELNITNVPESIETLNIYVKGLYDNYTLADGWKASAQTGYTQIALKQNATTPTTYEGNSIMIPCSDKSGVTFVAEATTTNGYTSFLSYTSSQTMAEGTHLSQTLKFSDLAIIEDEVLLGNWNEKDDEGTFSSNHALNVGERYFSQAATVNTVGQTSISLIAHKPMTVTLNDMRAWTDKKQIPYTLSPEINVQRWAFPTSSTTPNRFLYMVTTGIGWDAFDAQFAASGNTPINRNATNILAYYDNASDTFFCYDFANDTFKPVDNSSTEEFQLYPFGIIMILQ